ncbi:MULTISPECIES: hypothetical protein [unclassified Mesorhizobium]|uniref:hypothetical protein n=1 Tax=unclassified Mesorhizobium TaxID=325217 RepID=UPI003334AFD5
MRHNAYLYQGFKQFTANVKTASHCFFIFGHSLATNDDHILNRIARGKFLASMVNQHPRITSGS